MQITAERRVARTAEGCRGVAPATEIPGRQVTGGAPSQLNVSVVFTSVEGTLAALRTAGTLANRLGVHITLLVPEVVPRPLPLNKPPVLHDWNERRFRVLAAQSPVDTTVRFYLCRDRDETLANVLRPHSLVVVGGKRRWWPTSEDRLAKRLRHLGHEVILTETE